MIAAMVDTCMPLFGQRLGHLTPVAAGFLGVPALAVGWTVGEVASASLNVHEVIGHVVAAAPLASGLALGAVTQRRCAVGLSRCWRCLIIGTGIRIAWPHLTVRAGYNRRPGREQRGGRGDQHVQLISGDFPAPGWPVWWSALPGSGGGSWAI